MNMLHHPLSALLLLLAALPWLSSCSSDQPLQQQEEEQWANLSVSLSVPHISIHTRGIADDDDPSGWDDWQKAVDGQMLYHVTLFLMDKDGTLVGYRNLVAGSSDIIKDPKADEGENSISTTAAVASFNYLHPLHGAADSSVERLKGERYTLVAVANHSATTLSSKSYSGLTELQSKISTIITAFNAATASGGIANFTSTYSDFIQYKIAAGGDYICPQQPQPLVLVKHIDLHPGNNEVTGELLRTYSRIRIEVQNNSDSQDLTVQELSFCDYFAQQEAYLFYNPDNLDSRFTGMSVGSPTVTSTEAIKPFVANQTIAKRNGSGANQSAVIFDSYMLESKSSTNQTYTYRLKVAYVGAPSKEGYELVTTTPITTLAGLTDSWNSGIKLYALRNWNQQQRFLYNGGTTVESADVELEAIKEATTNNDLKYVWELEPYNASQLKFYIKSASTGNNYISNPLRDENIALVATKSAYFTYIAAKDDLTGICMKSSEGSDYINVYGGQQDQVRGWNDNDGGSAFYLYPIEKKVIEPKFDADIELKTIDAQTAVVTPVTQINRNDFINVLVTVAYNEYSGKFKFEVNPWTTKNEEITYE